jgi:hypothetical protein
MLLGATRPPDLALFQASASIVPLLLIGLVFQARLFEDQTPWGQRDNSRDVLRVPPVRHWTSKCVLAAMDDWRERDGRLPSSYDWSRTHGRGREALVRLAEGERPSASVVTPLFATLAPPAQRRWVMRRSQTGTELMRSHRSSGSLAATTRSPGDRVARIWRGAGRRSSSLTVLSFALAIDGTVLYRVGVGFTGRWPRKRNGPRTRHPSCHPLLE